MNVAWGLAQGWTVNQIPSPLPPLFSGDRMVVFGLLKPSENASRDGKNEVRLQGTLSKDEKMEHFMTFPTPPTRSATDTNLESNSSFFLHRLAAKIFIKVKQDDISGVYNGEQEFEETKTSIISVSKSANVVSKFTSFVAVDKNSHQPVSGPLKKHVFPSFAYKKQMSLRYLFQGYRKQLQQQKKGALGAFLPLLQQQLQQQQQQDTVFCSAHKRTKFATGFYSVPSPHGSLPFEGTPPRTPAAWYGGGNTALCGSAPSPSSVASCGGSSPYPSITPGAASLFGSAPSPPPAASWDGSSQFPSITPDAASPFGSPSSPPSVARFGGRSPYPFPPPGASSLFGSATLPQSVASYGGGPPYPSVTPVSSSLFGSPSSPQSVSYFGGSCPPLAPWPGAASHGQKEAPALLSLISLQKASGAWDLTDQLVSLSSTSRDALITACPAEIAIDTAEGKLLWATALALVLLMGKFSDQKDEWEMIAEKGKKWMKKNLSAAVTYNLLTYAASVVGIQI